MAVGPILDIIGQDVQRLFPKFFRKIELCFYSSSLFQTGLNGIWSILVFHKGYLSLLYHGVLFSSQYSRHIVDHIRNKLSF